jgi:hypothetical protein
MGYSTDGYRANFSAPYHIGRTANQDVAVYRRRSPAWNAAKLKTPLLIHTTTNDRDVNVLEVEHLIAQLKAAGKEFQYKIHEDAPGGHSFNRTDTPVTRASRQEGYECRARHLKKWTGARRGRLSAARDERQDLDQVVRPHRGVETLHEDAVPAVHQDRPDRLRRDPAPGRDPVDQFAHRHRRVDRHVDLVPARQVAGRAVELQLRHLR